VWQVSNMLSKGIKDRVAKKLFECTKNGLIIFLAHLLPTAEKHPLIGTICEQKAATSRVGGAINSQASRGSSTT
jgi:hypothetical protein